MAARYALQPFCFHNTVTGTDEHVEQGASRDSVTGQAFLQTPASFWASSPLTVAAGQIDPKLAAYLAAYPST
jgi:hypothetical protein